MSPRRDVSMSLEEVNQFLDSSKVAVLTTLGPGGWPHAAGMWYVRSDDTLQMWTYAKSQKARNLMRDERCAVVVESGEQYQELKGVLIRTRALLTDRYRTSWPSAVLCTSVTRGLGRVWRTTLRIGPRPEGTARTTLGGAVGRHKRSSDKRTSEWGFCYRCEHWLLGTTAS